MFELRSVQNFQDNDKFIFKKSKRIQNKDNEHG